MLKRVALIGATAALTIGNTSDSMAQNWGGWGPGGVTVTVGFPGPAPYPVPYRRPVSCCFGPVVPNAWYGRPYPYSYPHWPRFRAPYFYGDYFAPYGYNWNIGYDGYDRW